MQTLRTRLIEKLQGGRLPQPVPRVLSVHRRPEERHVHRCALQDDDRRRRDRSHRLRESREPFDGTRHGMRSHDRGARSRRRASRHSQPAGASACRTPWRRTLQPRRTLSTRSGSLCAAIEALRREERTLQPLVPAPQPSEAVLNMISVADPERPVELPTWRSSLTPEWRRTAGGREERACLGKDRGARARRCWPDCALEVHAARRVFSKALQITRWARRLGDEWWTPLAVIAGLYVRGADDVSAAADHVVRGRCVWSIARFRLCNAWHRIVGVDHVLRGQKLDRAAVRRVAGAKLNAILQVLRHRGLARNHGVASRTACAIRRRRRGCRRGARENVAFPARHRDRHPARHAHLDGVRRSTAGVARASRSDQLLVDRFRAVASRCRHLVGAALARRLGAAFARPTGQPVNWLTGQRLTRGRFRVSFWPGRQSASWPVGRGCAGSASRSARTTFTAASGSIVAAARSGSPRC